MSVINIDWQYKLDFSDNYVFDWIFKIDVLWY